MLALLDIRFSFICRTTYKNEDGNHPIVLRISFRNSRRDVFTGLFCSKESWNNKKGKMHDLGKSAISINDNLELIIRKANNAFDALRFSGEDFTIDELVAKLKGQEEEPELLIEYLERGNQAMLKRVGVEITQATCYKYRRSLQYMQEFLQKNHKAKNYTLKKINLKFMQDYFHFLRAEKDISHNVARRYLEFVKTIIYPAVRT